MPLGHTTDRPKRNITVRRPTPTGLWRTFDGLHTHALFTFLPKDKVTFTHPDGNTAEMVVSARWTGDPMVLEKQARQAQRVAAAEQHKPKTQPSSPVFSSLSAARTEARRNGGAGKVVWTGTGYQVMPPNPATDDTFTEFEDWIKETPHGGGEHTPEDTILRVPGGGYLVLPSTDGTFTNPWTTEGHRAGKPTAPARGEHTPETPKLTPPRPTAQWCQDCDRLVADTYMGWSMDGRWCCRLCAEGDLSVPEITVEDWGQFEGRAGMWIPSLSRGRQPDPPAPASRPRRARASAMRGAR